MRGYPSISDERVCTLAGILWRTDGGSGSTAWGAGRTEWCGVGRLSGLAAERFPAGLVAALVVGVSLLVALGMGWRQGVYSQR
jgi:hypothetical protein